MEDTSAYDAGFAVGLAVLAEFRRRAPRIGYSFWVRVAVREVMAERDMPAGCATFCAGLLAGLRGIPEWD